MPKIIVNPAGSQSVAKVAQLKKEIADQLGVLEEDVLIIPDATLTLVEVPTAMTKARADKDAHDKAEAEKAAKEKEKLDKAAAKAAADTAAAEAKAIADAKATAEAKQAIADAKAASDAKAEAKSHAKDK